MTFNDELRAKQNQLSKTLNLNSADSSVEQLYNSMGSMSSRRRLDDTQLAQQRIHMLYTTTLQGDIQKEKTLTLYQLGKVKGARDKAEERIESLKISNELIKNKIKRYQDLIREQKAFLAAMDIGDDDTYDGLTITARRDDISAISQSDHFDLNMSIVPSQRKRYN
jgi:hypothetical protein